uniref:Uncharacterized protein n=1 Tax=viral metagenome TaxID=1070528 RepID=A0A6C0KEC7_9ZZZZ
MSISEPDKISNLWKKSREVNDIYKAERYNNPAQTPYKENVFNESIFSDLVPDELPGNLIQVGNQFKHPESCDYLDTLYFNNGVPSGDVPTSGPNAVPSSQIATLNCQDPVGQPLLVRGKKLTSVPHLTFYHKVELYPHPEADGTEPSNSDTSFPLPGYKTKTTWYLPDANDINLSALRDTINFKKGTRGDYTYKIWTGQPGSNQFFTQKEADTPYSFVFDNKNGYFYIYGKDDQSNWDIDATGPNHSIFVSLIRYEGSKGASGSGGSLNNGLDVSFNNVDISNNLNFVHNDTYSLETGILQSKKMLFPMPLTSQSHENSVIIATVSGADDEFLNATGYYTVEIHDANYEEYNTKIHFIAGIITKENTNANYIPPPADTPLVNNNSSSSNGGVINDVTTQNVAINPIEQQLSVQPEQVTIQPITLEPITINPIGGGVTPTIDSDDDDGGTSTVTVNQNTTPTNIEYTGFIKVLSCDRQYYNVGTNFGIEYIQLIKEINSNTCHICLKLDSLSTLPSNSQNSIVFNVRLYKNSLNIMNDFNKLQWTLVDARIFTQTELIQNFTFIKSLYIAGVPDNTLPPLYPNFPTESFNATTQYTVIDNSVNIERELYIKGDINMVKNNHINLVENNKIKSVVNDLYEYKIFDNNDLTSTNIPNGSWQTIATIEPQSAQSVLTDQRSAYAMFEIIDRSNAGTNYKFVDNLSFIVNFTSLSSGSAHANITLLSKNPTGNNSGDVGYIDQIRVLCGRHNSTSSGASNGGANIQIRRICNNTGVGNTDIRVSMYNNYKGLNTKQEMNPFVLTSVGQTMQSGSTRTATINIEDSSFGFASTDAFNNKVSFQTLDVTNLNATNIEMGGYLDMNGNELRGLNGLTINGNLDMNGYNILENQVITSGNSVSSLPRISQTTDIDILVDDEDDPVITIGSGTANGQTQQIYFNCGMEVNLDMNDIEIKNTDLISKIMDTHKEKTNRAYIQQFNFNTATLPTTTRSDNLQPPWEIGGSAGDGDWITIGVTGSFIKDANVGPPYIGDGANKWRVNSKGSIRANALFELIDRTSGHHHTIKFYAGFKFGKPSIRILNNNTYDKTRFGAIRIVYGAGTALGTYVKTTYTGCVLQFQLLESSSQTASSADIEMNVWQNTENNGWKISRESVIIKENNPRCYVPTSVAQEYMKYNPIPSPPPIYSGPNGDGNYIPVGGSPYQYNLTIDTSEDLVLGTNNIYKGEKIITDELNAKDGSSFVKLAKEGEGIQIYGDAGSLDGLLAQSSNNGTNKNVFTINPNANTHTTFEVKLKHGPSSNRVETSGLSVNQDNIKLKVPLNLSTTTADILSGTYGGQSEYGKFETLGSNIGVELAASNTIGKNIINASGSTLYGQLPVIRTREPYTSGGGAVDNNYVMISETCYNLVSRYGLTDMFMDGPATSDAQSNNRRRFHGNDNAPTGSNATNFYSVGLIQSFKGEDLNKDSTSYEAGEWETPFRGKGWFTGCAFGWPQKSSTAGPLQVRGNAKLRLIVNGKTVIEWTSSNANSVNGSERTYNFSNVVLDLPSEDWVYCGNELEQSSLSDYPNDNVYNSNLKFTTEGTSLIYFQMVFPGPKNSNNYIEFPDDDNMNGRSPGTDSSLIRMNAFFASYPKLK